MKCEYCGKENKLVESQTNCNSCGGKLPEKKRQEDFMKSDPFFYNGYICYTLRDYSSDTYEMQFWQGRELIQRISLSSECIRVHVSEDQSYMPFFWELFLIAQGEREYIEVEEKNNKYPAMFVITRVENAEKVRIRGLSLKELIAEANLK